MIVFITCIVIYVMFLLLYSLLMRCLCKVLHKLWMQFTKGKVLLWAIDAMFTLSTVHTECYIFIKCCTCY